MLQFNYTARRSKIDCAGVAGLPRHVNGHYHRSIMSYVHVKQTCCDCVTVDAQDEPRITMEIWPEIKQIGMTGYLNCTVTRQSNNKVCQCQVVASVKSRAAAC